MVEYRLTARGLRLGPIIEAMRAYAREPPPAPGPPDA
jgi:DNA-binding HxlR family transcriptional regulator